MDVRKIVISAGLFGAGVGVGYFVCKKLIVEQYKQDLIDIKEFYMAKVEELGVMPRDFTPEHIIEVDDEEEEDVETDEETEDEIEVRRQYDSKVSKYSSGLRQEHSGKGKPIIKYNKPPLQVEDWGDLEEDEEDEDEDEMDLQYEAELEQRAEEFSNRKFENKMNGKPYVIDFNEFEDGPDDYDRISLYYYSKDRMLCEDDDTEVEDEEGIIGFDYEDVLDMQTTAWVRNDILMNLYEIHRIDESYQLTVLGAVETPREREFRITGRRKQALDD